MIEIDFGEEDTILNDEEGELLSRIFFSSYEEEEKLYDIIRLFVKRVNEEIEKGNLEEKKVITAIIGKMILLYHEPTVDDLLADMLDEPAVVDFIEGD